MDPRPQRQLAYGTSTISEPSNSVNVSSSRSVSRRGSNAEVNNLRYNVLNEGMHNVQHSRALPIMWFIYLLFNLPQIVVSIVLLAIHWSDPTTCTVMKYWIVVFTSYLGLSLASNLLSGYIDYRTERRRAIPSASVIRWLKYFNYISDVSGTLIFMVGCIWVLNNTRCATGNPVLYKLAFALILIECLTICAPCLVMILALPFMCFCMPLFIRVVLHHFGPRTNPATKEQIDQIPCVAYSSSNENPEDDPRCSICLNDYNEEDMLRLLHCKHRFHRACVDEWLEINGSCPICRSSISLPSAEVV